MGTNNKNLINAARYMDAIFDIQIDENHPNLELMVHREMLRLNSPEIEKYWNQYQIEVGVTFLGKLEN